MRIQGPGSSFRLALKGSNGPSLPPWVNVSLLKNAKLKHLSLVPMMDKMRVTIDNLEGGIRERASTAL